VEGIGITNHPRSRVLGHGEMVRIIMQGRKKMYEKSPGGKKENARSNMQKYKWVHNAI
jgi:hypothetical protein